MKELWLRSESPTCGSGSPERTGLCGLWDRAFRARRDRRAQDAILSWYFLEGLVDANLEFLLTQDQADALLAMDSRGTTRLERLIWAHDATARSRFTKPHDPKYRAWVRSTGAETYRLLSHPKISLAKPRVPAKPLAQGSLAFGVNLYGHAGARLGIGEDVRMALMSLQSAGVPLTLHSVPATGLPDVERIASANTQGVDYAINLFCLAGLETFQLARHRGHRLFDGHYNIGFWPWELPEWPNILHGCFDLVDEIWSSSIFTAEAFRKSSRKPVRHLPMAVTVDDTKGYGRRGLDLPTDRFLFGTALDGNSRFARKNPFAVIRAFQLAFPEDSSVGLVIKGQRVEGSAEWRRMEVEASNDPRILLLTGSFPRGKLLDLYRNLDVFISLHRSEGFGRNIAEAMLLAKPVIVTNYSGNLDFTTKDNALLVNAKLTAVKEGEYHFADGLEWAEPAVPEAAEAMKAIREDHMLRAKLSAAGRRTVAQMFNPEEVGARYRLELERIFAESAP
jgi:glycosyltransferase involved in cell wall biosynthesis